MEKSNEPSGIAGELSPGRIASREIAKYIKERRQGDLERVKKEFDQARDLLSGKGDSPIWNAFRQVERDLENELGGRVRLGLDCPKVTMSKDVLRIRGRYVVPTLTLRWDIRRGMFGFGSRKELRCSLLFRNDEPSDLLIGSGKDPDYKDPIILDDFNEIARVLSGYVIDAREQYGEIESKHTWEYTSRPDRKLDSFLIFSTAKDHFVFNNLP